MSPPTPIEPAARNALDKIIREALAKAMAVQEYYHGDYDVAAMAWVIRDALLAEGRIERPVDIPPWNHVLVLPLAGLGGDPKTGNT